MWIDHLPFVLLAAFIVGMSKGGLTSAGTLGVPLLAGWINPLEAAALLLPVYLISDLISVWLYRREFSTPNLKLLIPAGLAGIALASVLAPWLSVPLLTLVTGLIGLAYCLKAWLGKPHPPRTPAKAAGIFWGVVTGVTSFFSHSGAPPYQMYVLPQQMPKLIYAGTTTMVFTAINFAKLPGYFALGLFDTMSAKALLLPCLAGVAGAFAGRWAAIVLPPKAYIRIIQWLLLALSLRLLWQGVTGLS
jgi:uncharacterized membrane protein YfcA